MLLVRTPTPFSSESLFGYVLRVAEANGYDSPWQVMSHAGFNQAEMLSTVFPVDRLGKVLGIEAGGLDHIAYVAHGDSDDSEYCLLGHSFGGSLNCRPFRIRNRVVCPSCVANDGYIDAFWDLNVSIACPKHHCYPISHCQACDKPITNFRPGLLTCKCGASLAEPDNREVPSELIDLMKILWAKVHNERVMDGDLTSGLPIKELMGMPLKTLIQKLPELGRFNSGISASDSDMNTLLLSAASVLSDWPRNFRKFLHRIGNAEQSSGTGFRKRFEHFYYNFASRRVSKHNCGWLREEFLNFGLEEWGESLTDVKLFEEAEVQRRFVTRAALARQLGVRAITVSKWAEKGLVALKQASVSTSTRYIVDLNAIDLVPPLKTSEAILEARKAAAHLGIPVRVLHRLNALGHIPSLHKIKCKTGYAIEDLNIFLENLLKLSPQVNSDTFSSDDADVVSLGHILRNFKFHNHSKKSEFIVMYLSGSCKSVGRIGDSIDGIYFKKAEVIYSVQASRSEAADETLSQSEVAKLIGCDPMAIDGLISNQLLTAVMVSGMRRINRESVGDFIGHHNSLAALANDVGSTSFCLRRICNQMNMPLIIITTRYGVEVCFVARTSADVLREYFSKAPTEGNDRRKWRERPHFEVGV